jgi:hypothetical protein
VRTSGVKVVDVLAEHLLQMPAAEDEDVIQQLSP